MTNSTPSISDQAISLGQQLQQARLALNLSIEEVAKQTNLKKNHIESLEEDIFIIKDVPPAFVRGYMRNYVRFLRLPESLIQQANYGEVTLQGRKIEKASGTMKVNHKSQNRWVKFITILILLTALGMTLIWWWQDYQKEQQNREALVNGVNSELVASPSTSEQAVEKMPEKTAEMENSLPVDLEKVAPPAEMPLEAEKPSEVATLPVALPSEKPLESATVVNPTTVEPTPAPVETDLKTSSTELKNDVPVVNVLQTQAVASAQQTVEPQQEVKPEVAAITDELRVEIKDGASWLSVRGTKNKKLAERLYNAGEVLNFNGNEQYFLKIGAPVNVKIYYKGQEVPLKIDGRVARIRLPLAQ